MNRLSCLIVCGTNKTKVGKAKALQRQRLCKGKGSAKAKLYIDFITKIISLRYDGGSGLVKCYRATIFLAGR